MVPVRTGRADGRPEEAPEQRRGQARLRPLLHSVPDDRAGSDTTETPGPQLPQLDVHSGEPAATLAERRALSHTFGTRYARADKAEKTRILDHVCAATGWHRSHARKALLKAAKPKPAKPLRSGHAKYDADVVAALTFCWTILDMPAGKRLAPVLPELVPVLRRHDELALDDATAELLMGMSAATIDRRLAPQRKRQRPGAAATRMRPGSLLRNELPLVTWAEWDHARPGFMEITVVRHDGGGHGSGNSGPGSGDGPRAGDGHGDGAEGGHLRTVSATDIATGWTENRTVRAVNRIPFALDEIAGILPFPILGLDSGNHGAETDELLLHWCRQRRVTFTHARPARSGNHHVGQKNWSVLHAIADDFRYSTTAELLLLNKIWTTLSRLTNYFYPQQHSVSVTEEDGRRRKEYDTATPYRRTTRHSRVTAEDKAILTDTYACLNPAELHRQLKVKTGRLHMMASDQVKGAAPAAAS